ncbi:1-acyl-sn-glycerol-3-phosphate acyltransferase [Pseudomonas sp. NPDC007930]|uniref:lysophospholipid acyltransferase family protein n=1 Tax=Pseudomonas sp. NPDC007930 TaxID=3364417 RepID=UPI0036EA03A3
MRAVRLLWMLLVVLMGLAMAASLMLLERFKVPGRHGLPQRCMRRFMAALCRALPLRVQVHGALPATPMLWLSNHVSWMDIAVIGQLAPISFLSKDEVRRWPVAGWLATRAGTFYIRRGAGDSQRLRQDMAEHLHRRGPVLIFPEGTTTDGRDVRTFHGRLLACAVESGAPVQPVALRYLRNGQPCDVAPFVGDDDMLSHLMRVLSAGPIDVEVHLLPPIASRGQERAALAHAAQGAVRTVLQRAPQAVPEAVAGAVA